MTERFHFGNTPSFVEVAGIEPASFGFSTGLLRAQPVGESRSSHRHRHRCEAPADESVPAGLSAQPAG